MFSIFNSLFAQILLALVIMQIGMLVFYFLRKSDTSRCPVCGNVHCDRQKRPVYVRLFLPYFSGLKYYFCISCKSHFFSTNAKEAEKRRI